MLRTHYPSLSLPAARVCVTRSILAFAAVALLCIAPASPGMAAAPHFAGTLTAGSASAAAGNNVAIAVTLSSGAGDVCTLQFDLQFSSSLSYVSTATGAAAAAASKTASGNAISGGVRVLIFNLNRNIIGAGSVAVVTLAIAPGTPAGSIPVTVTNLTASDPDGISISVATAAGSVTVLAPPDTTPPVISGVSSSGITTSGATISWTTNEASDTQVEYGPTVSYGSSTTINTSMVTSHSQALSGLSASTTYYYRVKSRDAAGNLATSGNFTFTTATPPDTTPPVISGVSSSGITTSGATISWTTNEASDTQVEYGPTVSYGSSTTLNTSMVTSHSQALSGLSASTTYYYRVKSRDAAGNLATSGNFTFTTATPDTTPPVISGVSSSGITASGATISWTTNEASDTEVEYGPTASYGSSTTLNTSMVTSHSQALSGLSASTTYYYRVKSRDAAGNLATSGNFTFRTSDPADTIPPVISGVASGNITSSGATITWTTNEDSDSQVEYGVSISYSISSSLNVSMVTSHSQALTGLAPGTIYYFRVKSRDAAGNLATSGNFTFRTGDPPDTTPPVISGVASGNISSSGAAITWTTNEDSDSQVEYGVSLSYGSSSALNATMVTSHSQALTGLAPGTIYYFRVKSRDAAGNLATSGNFTFRTGDAADTTPPVISGVATSNISSVGATISWTTDEASDSQVEYGVSISYGSSSALNATMVTSHTQALTGLAPGTIYYFRVKSRDAAGNLATSGNFTFRTSDAADTTPPVISGVATSNISSVGATISWTTDEASDSQVEFGTSTSYGSSTTLDANLVTAHSRTLSGLTAATTYHFRIKSRDAAGNLAISGDFTLTTSAAPDTTPPVISSVTVSNITSSGATISWATDKASTTQVEYGMSIAYGNATPLDANLVLNHAQALAGLQPGTTYHARVKSVDLSGNQRTSDDITFTTLNPVDTTPPVVSDVMVSNITVSGATITWTTNEAADTRVFYGTSPAYGTPTELDANLSTSHTRILSELSPSTTYHFRVESRDAAGNLTLSDNYMFTTLAAPDEKPPVISEITVIALNQFEATISWITDKASDSQIFFGFTSDYDRATMLDTRMVTFHIQTLTGLLPDTTYHYRIASRNAAGNHSISGDIILTTSGGSDTATPIISNVAISGITCTGATVSWTTNEAADSQLEYGLSPAYGNLSALNPELALTHAIALGGLKAGTTYHFRLLSRDAAGNLGISKDFTFTTSDLPVISGVAASPITSQRAYVSWCTDIPATAQVMYGKTAECELVAGPDTTLAVYRTLRLNGLDPETTYYFRVQSASETGGVSVSDTLTFTTRPPALMKLAYPRMVNSTGDITATADGTVVDMTQYTGLTIANLSSREAVMTFTAYDRNGDVIYGIGITNPADRSIPAGAQLSILGHDLFGSLFADHYAVGWMEIESSVDEIVANALVFDASLASMDSTPINGTPSTRVVFNEIESQGFTNINLANPNEQPATVTFELRAAYGMPLASAVRTLAGKAALSESIVSLFPGTPMEACDYIFAVSDVGIVALEMVGKAAQDFAGLNAMDADTGVLTLYSPHYSAGGTSRSTLSIVNLDDMDGRLIIRLVGDDGAQIGPTRVVDIAANGKVFIDDQSFFNSEKNNPIAGYLVIKSSGPRIVGNLVFGDVNGSAFTTALPLASQLENSMLFNQVVWNETYFMGLALVNPTINSAVAEIQLYREDGTLEISAALVVPARQRIYQALSAFFPELEGQMRNSGYLRVVTDAAITGFTTVGTRDMKCLSALPPQAPIRR